MQTDGRAALLAVLATLVAITVATNTTASLAQPQIGDAFLAGPADTAWVVFGYSATFAVGTALWGGIASRTGIIPALVAGVGLLGLGSLGAALAPSLEVVIGTRLVQGLGSGAIPTLATALIAGRFESADRARALGVIIAAVGVGQALGPVLGGVLLEIVGWRAAVSIGVVAIPAVVVLARSQRGRAAPVGARRIDWTGAALVAVVALSLTFVLNRGPLLGPHPVILVPLGAGLVAVAFVVRRAFAHRDAFVPADVLRNRVFQAVVPLGALGLSAYIGTIVLVPILGARAYGLDGIELGLLLLPMALAAAVSSPSNARVQAWIGPMATTRLALALLGFGPIVIGLTAIGAGPVLLGVGLAMLGAGFGLLNAPLLSRLTHAVGGDRQPVAVGVYNLCFFLGGAIGASISSAIVQAAVELPGLGSPALPGFTTALIVVAVGPLLASVLVARGTAGVPDRYRRGMARLPRPAAVLFDLDGTLVDTVPARIRGWEAVFAETGIPATREQLAALIGIDGRRLAREVAGAAGGELDDEAAERVDRRAGELFDQANREPRPLPGARLAIERVERAGVTWAIATSSRTEQVAASVEALGLRTQPRIIDGSRVEHAKPAPDLLLLAARDLGVEPARTWYVGDSTWDMQAARAAGMVAIGVLAGAAVREDQLRAAGGTVVLETLDELRVPD
ncbi:MAG TPA: MFS transporter [Candidatus Limnocylindrales bacterium]|nr:MFS transporter [Candidatus Limnocylindrales bacterium]